MTPDTELKVFDPVLHEIAEFVSSGALIKVDSIETCGKAMISAKQVKLLEKAVEDRRKEIVGPLNERVKAVNAYAKSLLDPLHKAESKLKTEMISWEKKLEFERVAEARKIDDERKKKEAELIAKQAEEMRKASLSEAFGTPAVVPSEASFARESFEVQKSFAVAERANEANKVSGTQKAWVFKIINEDIVPKEFKVINAPMIRMAIKNGERSIPGVEIYEEVRMSIRS